MTGFDLIYQLLSSLKGNPLRVAAKDISTKEGAYEELKLLTQEDFGYDVDAWRKYFNENDYANAIKGIEEWRKVYNAKRLSKNKNEKE